ncbi:MAG: flagellar FlbD family protein, partial [Spirochaetaceae bacterium]|nr:flagellar FlbD family protein [Spirochaetaceae bacterium]
MVKVTRLDGYEYHVNPHQIEYIEQNPDTTLIMLSGKRLV